MNKKIWFTIILIIGYSIYCNAESPKNLIILPDKYVAISDKYIGTQYFFDLRYNLSTYDIYNSLKDNFKDFIIQIVNFNNFKVYQDLGDVDPETIPIEFSEEIQKRIIFTPIVFYEGYFITPSLEKMINDNFLVSMYSKNYQLIIQCLTAYKKTSDKLREQYLVLSLSYYGSSLNTNDTGYELDEFIGKIKNFFIFTEKFPEENFIENEEIFLRRFEIK